jgi:transcriptional regulator with XRE-family HTH domain
MITACSPSVGLSLARRVSFSRTPDETVPTRTRQAEDQHQHSSELGNIRGHPVTAPPHADRASQPPGCGRTVVGVDSRAEVREFLTSRRAKITPEQARVPQAGCRRVPGLRRSEVAALAGMSVEYYAKLERGALGGVSASVLDAIARALQLDEAERAHLFYLAQAADGTSAAMRPRRRSNQWTARASLQWTLDTITTAAAIIGNNMSDLLATNHLAGRFRPTSTTTPTAHRTSPGSPSSTALRTGSTPTGTSPPT